jgi:hypothetical protein
MSTSLINIKGDNSGIPVHPTCFSIFKRLSLDRLGRVDIDGLRQLWLQHGDYHPHRFDFMSEDPELANVNLQEYEHVIGTEYLASNPNHIVGLQELFDECSALDGDAKDNSMLFTVTRTESTGSDPFSALPPELKLIILFHLDRKEVASLRHVSRSFQQLPQQYFHHLILTEMPWLWEVKCMESKYMNWHKLWCALSAADGGAGMDYTERQRDEYGERMAAALHEWGQQKIHDLQDKHAWDDHMAIFPKPTQIHGLRNRRRIYKDIMEMLDRIATLVPEDT